MTDLVGLLRSRRSARVPFDPARAIAPGDLDLILEAARWAPTPHNMQNFEIVVVDDAALLESLGEISTTVSPEFLRENYAQLSFSDEELARRKIGILGAGFPPSWLDPAAWESPLAGAERTRKLQSSLLGCPMLLVVLYDTGRRAPASEGDALGLIGLGCVLENMWLAAQSRGISLQVLATLAGGDLGPVLAKLLNTPDRMRVAFGCRLGYPLADTVEGPRVRRDTGGFAFHNVYGNADFSGSADTR